MLKSVFKEIIIILLLILIILILLGILFYDYIPNKETIPSKAEEYQLADDVKIELEKELNNINSEEIIKTYQLDATKLEQYEKTKEYNKGKVNPFAEYGTGTVSGSTSTQNNGQSSSGSSASSNGTANSSTSSNSNANNNTSSGTFLNTVGK